MAVLIRTVQPSPGVGRIEALGISIALAIALLGLALAFGRDTRWATRLGRLHWGMLLVPLVLAAVLALVSAAALVGAHQLGADFAHDRTTGTRKILQLVVRPAGLGDVGVCRCAPDREVPMSFPGSFETKASVYDDGWPGARPGVLILHGNTWLGRNLAIYRLLAERLAELGYVVLTFDYVGKGESDDPFRYGRSGVPAAFDFPAQTRTAIAYMRQNLRVDPDDITVFGHSRGVDWAELVGVTSDRVSRVALMVAPPPPPPSDAVISNSPPDVSDRYGDTYRLLYDKPVPDWFRWSMTGDDDRGWSAAHEALRTPGHKPILVLLGERDEPRGHDRVEALFAEYAEPKKLVKLDRSDHYANAGQGLGLTFYDKAVADDLVGELVAWIESTRR
jgi:dienelactone hydrolase